MEIFYTAVGVLQRDAPLEAINPKLPVTHWSGTPFLFNFLAEDLQKSNDSTQNFVKVVTSDLIETSKRIEFLIDNLPGIEMTKQQQLDEMNELEKENQKVSLELAVENEMCKHLLEKMKQKMDTILENHLTH